MKTKMCTWAAAAAMALASSGAFASIVTVGSWSIEGSNTLNSATVIVNDFGGLTLTQVTDAGGGFQNNIREETATVPLIGAGVDDQAIDFGGSDAATTRGRVEYSLTGKQLVNQAGDDIWVTEAGGTGAPEAFMVRVFSSGSWSSWVYKYADVQWDPNSDSSVAFFTGYDFVADFGLAPSALVDKIQIQNGNNDDTTVSGEGASWEVPVHIVTRDPELLARFVALGFTPGLEPKRPALGGMHDLTSLLLRALAEPLPLHAQPATAVPVAGQR